MPNGDSAVCFISRWQLRSGLDEEMVKTLHALASKVESCEPDTLMYRVNLAAPYPLGPDFEPLDPTPSPIALADQKEVIFLEMYSSPKAFADHVSGETFQKFLHDTQNYFKPDPHMEGWPASTNTSMSLVTGFARQAASASH